VPDTLCSILTEFRFSRQIFTIVSNIKYEANPSSGSRAVIGREVDGWTDGREDMTKLIGAFRDYTDAPKNIAALSTQQGIVHDFIFLAL
jgi:hypothetical protein